ncbi:Cohesin subunit psc3 [Cytospora mali]|uniref:Cohesin subunit psc3 n=1 Tax=Cytospora mali TaxID=578113 RepID=A0A194UYQ5_CYTMA|nr:Cohesin subunit psc3 [Valsa mali var. pyri (nom. inval.)]
MDTSENTATPSPAPAARRRSGRQTRVPEKFQPETTIAPKRKRGAQDEEDDVENYDPEEEDEESSEEEADDSPAVEERPRSRKKSASQPSRAKKPAAKKPKINGAGPSGSAMSIGLPSRPKPKKTARVVTGDRRDGDGVYADIFGSGDNSDDVASRWYQKYKVDNEAAVTDLVNCVLLASGCDEQVTEDDIRDPDNIQNRLSELQDLYQEKQITDYPLAKAKESRSFRDLLVNFFESLIKVLHETDVLYTDEPLMENIARWVYTMSSSTLRPFRHTATTIALAMELALASVAKKLDDRITKTSQQLDTERARKGKNKNKEMLANLQKSLNEANNNREMCGKYMLDCFEVVFVHRYRDIDARIRTECVEALGSWIWVLPTVFMEPEYLRYLGWLLSDVVPTTRQEVLKQLSRVFKRDASKLGHFIDRFRPRLMEMATRDLDASVRVAAISVIEALAEAGMLEPDEIDAVGKLIFDSEPRIRKAVVKFFADCVLSVVEQKVESIGGEEAVDEMFPESEDVEDTAPRKEWLEVKALAETLAVYESQLDEGIEDNRRGLDISAEMANAIAPETRMSLAAQVLYEKMEPVKNWEILTGYLLHDHSASTKSKAKSKANSQEATMRQHVAPAGQEEAILLEVLVAAVKQNLFHIHEAEKGKKSRFARGDVVESAEDVALHLAQAIPKLLNKFGAESKTATTVLRLQHLLDLDVFQQLRQDSSTFEHLLDGICTQFNRHVDKDVVAEATLALLHSRRCEEYEEMVDLKIMGLWETIIDSLRNFDISSDLSERGELTGPVLSGLSNVLMKISNLARVKDCIDVLEAEGTEESTAPVIEILTRTVHRGRFQQPDEELDDLEDETVLHAIKCCHFYFMWKVLSLRSAIEMQTDVSTEALSRLTALRKTYQANLIHTLSSRAVNDDLRLFATGSLCDLHLIFVPIRRTLDQWSAVGAAKKYAGLLALIQEIKPGLIPELISVFDGAERAYAKKAKKDLNEPAEDEDPIDDDQLSDTEDDGEIPAEERRASELRAEKALCELTAKYVLAIMSKAVDQTGPHAGKLKKRLLRNSTKLGTNFNKTVAFLDDKVREIEEAKKRKAALRAKSKQPAAKQPAKPALSAEIVVADDDEDDEEEQPEEGTEEDLRRRELLDDPIEDPESEAEEIPAATNEDVDDESILGD